mmetsp:Transcript_5664/g.4312  ORF Transcript_5664/g.4312 Transcript_5664/m.4312 type:complete len:102 (-) Transcript_5664:504-809(-)
MDKLVSKVNEMSNLNKMWEQQSKRLIDLYQQKDHELQLQTQKPCPNCKLLQEKIQAVEKKRLLDQKEKEEIMQLSKEQHTEALRLLQREVEKLEEEIEERK